MVIKLYKPFIPDAEEMVAKLADFLHIEAKLPSADKKYISSQPIKIDVNMSRQDIIDYLQSIRKTCTTAELAFYAWRDVQSCDRQPFIKAAIERNPVSIEKYKSQSMEQIYEQLQKMSNESIYDGKRFAQPDEVANYETGDGLEKAFLLANIIHARSPEQKIKITVDNNKVILRGQSEYNFESGKGFQEEFEL